MPDEKEPSALVKDLKLALDDLHKKYPQAGIMMCCAERDAKNVGFDVQTFVSERVWLGLFLKAVWDYQQTAENDEPEHKDNVH